MHARGLEREARKRTEHLQRLTSALSAALLPTEIASMLVAELVASAKADFALVALLREREDELELLGSHGLDASHAAGTCLSVADTAAARPLETREATFLESWAAGTLPGLPRESDGDGAAVLLPLVVADRSIGIVALGWTKQRSFEQDDREFLRGCAAQASQALERARLHTQTAAAARRSALMAKTTHALIEVKTTAQRAERLARAVIPEVADGAWVQLLASGDKVVIDVAAGDERAMVGGEGIARRALTTGEPQLALRVRSRLLRDPAADAGQHGGHVDADADRRPSCFHRCRAAVPLRFRRPQCARAGERQTLRAGAGHRPHAPAEHARQRTNGRSPLRCRHALQPSGRDTRGWRRLARRLRSRSRPCRDRRRRRSGARHPGRNSDGAVAERDTRPCDRDRRTRRAARPPRHVQQADRPRGTSRNARLR